MQRREGREQGRRTRSAAWPGSRRWFAGVALLVVLLAAVWWVTDSVDRRGAAASGAREVHRILRHESTAAPSHAADDQQQRTVPRAALSAATPLDAPSTARYAFGRVVDPEGIGIAGVTVHILSIWDLGFGVDLVAGTPHGTRLQHHADTEALTDAGGHYVLSVPSCARSVKDQDPPDEWAVWARHADWAYGLGWTEMSRDDVLVADRIPMETIRLAPEVSVRGRLLSQNGLRPLVGRHLCAWVDTESEDFSDGPNKATCTETDAEGRFQMVGLQPGRFVLVLKPREVDEHRHIAEHTLAAGSHDLGDVVVKGLRDIHGTVRDPQGDPVVGARVIVSPDGTRHGLGGEAHDALEWLDSFHHLEIRTGDDGQFAFLELLDPPHDLAVLAEGFEPRIIEVSDLPPTGEPWEVRLEREAVLVLTVLDAVDGQPLSEAVVTARRESRGMDSLQDLPVLGPAIESSAAPGLADRAAAQGVFVVRGLGPHRNLISVTCAGRGTVQTAVTDMPAGAREERVIALHPAAVVTGRWVNDLGEPLPDVTTRLEMDFDSWAVECPRQSVDTDSSGRFRFEALEPGPWQLRLSASGVRRDTVLLELQAGETLDLGDLVCQRTATLQLSVLDAAGELLERPFLNDSNLQVERFYRGREDRPGWWSTVRHHDMTWDGEAWQIEVAAARHRVRGGEETRLLNDPDFVLAPGEQRAVVVAFGGTARLQGRLDAVAGLQHPGSVWAKCQDSLDTQWIYSSIEADGSWSVQVGDGTWIVTASTSTEGLGPWVGSSAIHVHGPGVHVVDLLPVPRGSSIRGRVLRAEDLSPIRGASVWIHESSSQMDVKLVTDDRGEFQILDLAPGFHQVSVRWGSRSGQQRVPAEPPDGTCEFRLLKSAALSGSVRRLDGGWLPVGLEVVATRIEDAPLSGQSPERRTTVEDGRFRFDGLVAARYRVSLEDEDPSADEEPRSPVAHWTRAGRDALVGETLVDLRGGGEFDTVLDVRVADR